MPGDAGLFRDYLLERGMSASSVKRVITSVRAILYLVIKERGLCGSSRRLKEEVTWPMIRGP